MQRRPKDFSQIARLETAGLKLESAKKLLMAAGEPMMSAQVSALLNRTLTELERAREAAESGETSSYYAMAEQAAV